MFQGVFGMPVFGSPPLRDQLEDHFGPVFGVRPAPRSFPQASVMGLGALAGGKTGKHGETGYGTTASDCQHCDPGHASMKPPHDQALLNYNSGFVAPERCGGFEGAFYGSAGGLSWKLFDRNGWVMGFTSNGYKLVAKHDNDNVARGYMLVPTANKTLYCVVLQLDLSYAAVESPISMTLIRCTYEKTWTYQLKGCGLDGCFVAGQWTLTTSRDDPTSPILKRIAGVSPPAGSPAPGSSMSTAVPPPAGVQSLPTAMISQQQVPASSLDTSGSALTVDTGSGTTKWVLIGGGVAALGLVGYLVWRSKRAK